MFVIRQVIEYVLHCCSMLELLSLPDIVLEKILSYLTYDDIARYRIVRICRYLFLDFYSNPVLHPLP